MPRIRPLGVPTRGSTAPQRLRRVDRWITGTQAHLLGHQSDPLVVDLGFGAKPVTTLELASRLAKVRPGLEVVGIDIDPERVAAAQPAARPGVRFLSGGFELAGVQGRPILIRAMNVLRQYDATEVPAAWATLARRLAAPGLLVEGTSDETGRRASWLALDATGTPQTLTLAAHLPTLRRPGELAERLPKVLIHRNVAGQPIHAFLAALDTAWTAEAGRAAFSPRQRFAAAVARLAGDWPLVGTVRRWRLGEVTVAWPAVAPLD
ncbi:MAG: class I SAM-dependent methyltransferase [Mycobacteriales bacterium]